tara:strand:- start:1023 stop:1406 length:384 start_codon:yes stop_codon:yes gene_type:complete
MLSSQDYNAIEQICNSSFGRSSTTRSPSVSIKTRLLREDQIEITYTSVVNFATEEGLFDQTRKLEEESVGSVADFIKDLKKKFKESTGSALKVKMISSNPSMELVNLNVFSPMRTSYFRNKCVYEIS